MNLVLPPQGTSHRTSLTALSHRVLPQGPAAGAEGPPRFGALCLSLFAFIFARAPLLHHCCWRQGAGHFYPPFSPSPLPAHLRHLPASRVSLLSPSAGFLSLSLLSCPIAVVIRNKEDKGLSCPFYLFISLPIGGVDLAFPACFTLQPSAQTQFG